jgi:hypothetical protein
MAHAWPAATQSSTAAAPGTRARAPARRDRSIELGDGGGGARGVAISSSSPRFRAVPVPAQSFAGGDRRREARNPTDQEKKGRKGTKPSGNLGWIIWLVG